MKRPEFKPCPFCGSTMIRVSKKKLAHYPGWHDVYAYCRKCFARGPIHKIKPDSTPEEENEIVEKSWNERA